jgi:hypothetical protein
MRLPRVRLSVFQMILAVVVCAIVSYVVSEPLRGPVRERYERCRSTADNHSRTGNEYRRNAEGDPVRLRIASWHEHMGRVFDEAAARPETPLPISQPFPPKGWMGPEELALAPSR